MANVIVAFSRQEDARSIKQILTKSGFPVVALCCSGAQTLAQTENLSHGVVVCGFRLTDMLCTELREYMPPEFAMLMVASPDKHPVHTGQEILCLSMPLKVHDLVETLGSVLDEQARRRRRQRQQPRKRREEEQVIIRQAKALLMESRGMTEAEAHRYIQKCSMDTGTSLTETAQMVISLKRGEQKK